MKKLLQKLADSVITYAKKTPYIHLPGYMERYWVREVKGNRWITARVHHILRSDDDRAFHDHPWPYLTIILRGGYWEVRPVYDKSGLYTGDSRIWHGPGSVLWRPANSWHRLELPAGQTAWTLFIMGKYRQKWGFMPTPAIKVRYEEYLKEHGHV